MQLKTITIFTCFTKVKIYSLKTKRHLKTNAKAFINIRMLNPAHDRLLISLFLLYPNLIQISSQLLE